MKYRNIKEYLRKTKTKQLAFASELDISESYASLLKDGKRTPSGPLALRIHFLTGIPLANLLGATQASEP